jgi:hypothetical protein
MHFELIPMEVPLFAETVLSVVKYSQNNLILTSIGVFINIVQVPRFKIAF